MHGQANHFFGEPKSKYVSANDFRLTEADSELQVQNPHEILQP